MQKKKNYQEFKNFIVEETGKKVDYKVKTQIVYKNNLKKEALFIQSHKTGAIPVIYLDDFFKNYKNGISLKQILNEIL